MSGTNEPLQVLLIENQLETISTISLMFAEIKACKLQTSRSYKEAWEQLSNWEPDLILLSHGLSGRDGIDAAQQIYEKYPSVYLIIFLRSVEETLVGEYIKAGANGFAFSDRNFLTGVLTAVKKALIRLTEKKSSLLDSVSGSSFFPPDDDSFDLLHLSTLNPGESVLHYRILQEIGEGGMGEIYLAEDQKLGRQLTRTDAWGRVRCAH